MTVGQKAVKGGINRGGAGVVIERAKRVFVRHRVLFVHAAILRFERINFI